VAGLIAAAANNEGGVGVAPGVKVQMVRALGSMGGESKDLAAAINWAAGVKVDGVPLNPTPAKVINMSLGTDTPQRCDAGTQAAVDAVKAMGVTMVTAAGNTGVEAFWSYPGNCFGTINVGATGFSGDRAWYSNYGLGVDISAPGGDSRNSIGSPEGTFGRIYSTSNDGRTSVGNPTYSYQEGTSMAAPILAGVIALMYSVQPTISFDEVWSILKSTVTPFASGTSCSVGVGTDSQLCGAGIVNAGAAVEAAIKLR
jgi:serine protease